MVYIINNWTKKGKGRSSVKVSLNYHHTVCPKGAPTHVYVYLQQLVVDAKGDENARTVVHGFAGFAHTTTEAYQKAMDYARENKMFNAYDNLRNTLDEGVAA